jgi:hypothetical protein
MSSSIGVICWEEEELDRMLHDMETEDTVLKQTLPLVEEKQDRIEEGSTTTYDIMEQTRGKKRRRNYMDRINGACFWNFMD